MILRLSVRVDEPVTGTVRQHTVLVDTATFTAAKWASIQAAVTQMGQEVAAEAGPKLPAVL